jgi:hypothetical protein
MIVTNQRFQPLLMQWLEQRCPGVLGIEGTVHAIAYVDAEVSAPCREEDVLTVCALSRWTPHTCEATLASNGAKRAKASREYIWTIFDYVFNQAGRSRLYTFVGVDNDKSIAIQLMLGLRQEAVLSDHFGEGKDGLLFSITKSQWLAGPWASKESAPVAPPN